jgi:hypothetical protein
MHAREGSITIEQITRIDSDSDFKNFDMDD